MFHMLRYVTQGAILVYSCVILLVKVFRAMILASYKSTKKCFSMVGSPLSMPQHIVITYQRPDFKIWSDIEKMIIHVLLFNPFALVQGISCMTYPERHGQCASSLETSHTFHFHVFILPTYQFLAL